MLTATLLALAAAVLHATWNLLIKQSGDRWIALWAMSLVAGGLAGSVLAGAAVLGYADGIAWRWAVLSSIVQLGYLRMLAWAYDRGDFSVAYPIARGGGALLAAIGGVLFLGDHLSLLSALGISVAVSGLVLLALGRSHLELAPALAVAAAIGTYTLIDSKGSRATGSPTYALLDFVAIAVTTSMWGLGHRQGRRVVAVIRADPRRTLLAGVATTLAYGMVLVAVQHAPVGYVTALRESSVVLAALAGWRLLGEGDARRRLTAAGVTATGLVLLVAAR